jgi:AcrR family transcriptional regulator
VAKAEARRQELLELLADYVLARGLSASSLRPLAKAAGLSDRMLLYYFKDKDALMQAILMRIVERLTVRLNALVSTQLRAPDDLVNQLLPPLMAPDLWPYMCVWLEIAALSARGDRFYRSVGGQIGAGFLTWGGAQLEDPTPEKAKALLIQVEGSLLLHSLGLTP